MLVDLVDKYLADKQEARSKRERSGMWSPSLFGCCHRRQYWNRLNEPVTNPPDSRALRIFYCGNLFHDFIQGFIPDTQTEVECKGKDILGFADVVNGDTVYDIKSVHSRKFHYLVEKGEDVRVTENPKWLQVATYGQILKKDNVALVFISKDDMCIKEYTDKTSNWIAPLKAELTSLRDYWSRNVLPPPQPVAYGSKKLGDKECEYCSFKNKCYEVEKHEHK